jgi:hypothetical protein
LRIAPEKHLASQRDSVQRQPAGRRRYKGKRKCKLSTSRPLIEFPCSFHMLRSFGPMTMIG